MLALWKKNYDQPRQHIKNRDTTLPTKVHIVKAMVFPSSHVWMWKVGNKKCWALKNWCLQTVVLQKTLESPLDSKEIKSINSKGNQFWIFIGRTDAEAETPILWLPDVRSQLTGKDLNAGKDLGQEKGTIEHEIVRWTDSMDMNLHKLWKTVRDRRPWWVSAHGIATMARISCVFSSCKIWSLSAS